MTMADIVVVVSFDIFFSAFFFFYLLFLDGGRRGLLLDFDLHVGHGGTSAAKVSLSGAGVLEVVVRDGRLDGILCKHRAVHYTQG